jgi:hypothetical protein
MYERNTRQTKEYFIRTPNDTPGRQTIFLKCSTVKQREVSEVPSGYVKTNNIHGRSTGFRIKKNINNKNCGKLMSTFTQSA